MAEVTAAAATVDFGAHLSGRTLTEFDGAPSSLPAAIINQAMARLFWRGDWSAGSA